MYKKNFLRFCLSLPLICAPFYIGAESPLFGSENGLKLVINNRVLVKINGKPITVMDLVKKMDMIFYRQFPEYVHSLPARFQFYQVNWKEMLNDLIEKELILADAEEQKIPVSNGDVREEMEALFGPNIISNLDKAGLTFDEAFKIIQGDIKFKRMMYVRVNAKAIKSVTPKDIKTTYEATSNTHVKPDLWVYQVISIRDKESARGKRAAQKVYDLLNRGVSLDKLSEELAANADLSTTPLKISEEYRHTEKEISEANQKILNGLTPGSFSEPASQKSRQDGVMVYRILVLKQMQRGGVVPLAELENKIRNELINKEVDKEASAYLEKLKKRFSIQKMLSDDFEPFALQSTS